jgi:hypothetical protein
MTNENANTFRARADDMGDALRRYLVGLNTGGIGVIVALYSGEDLEHHGVWQFLIPIISFVAGLLITGWSIGLQKHKAIQRRKSAMSGGKGSDYSDFYLRNQTYDIISGAAFILGFIIGVFGLLCGA